MDLRDNSRDRPEEQVSGQEDIENDVGVVAEALLYDEKAETDSLYFQFLVTSPSMIGKKQPGGFILPTLPLEEFSEGEVRNHIQKLLMQVKSCSWSFNLQIQTFRIPQVALYVS